MPAYIVDLLDKVPVNQLKLAVALISIFFVTGGSGYAVLLEKHEQLKKEAQQERIRIEKQVDIRFDAIERRGAEDRVILKGMADQIKQMHSVIYRPIKGT